MDQFGVEILVYLFAEIVDVYVDKVGSGIKVGIPYFFVYFYIIIKPLYILFHVE